MKIFDKASWQIDGGMPAERVISHFQTVFDFLSRLDMLSEEGKEVLFDIGIDTEVSLHERLLTPEAVRFFALYYDDYVEKSIYSSAQSTITLDGYYSAFRKIDKSL